MAPKRKHTLEVNIVFKKPCTEQEAFDFLMENISLQGLSTGGVKSIPTLTKTKPKSKAKLKPKAAPRKPRRK